MEKNRKVANANASVNLLTWLAATHLLHIQQRSPVPFPQKMQRLEGVRLT